MAQKNLDIRQRAKDAKVRLWEIADYLGMSDVTFCRRLRHELSQEEKDRVISAIEDLRKEEV